MGTITGLIVGAVLTYLLTSSKELSAYRRERLEKLAFDIKELHKTIDTTNRRIIDFFEKPDDLEIVQSGIDIQIQQLTDRIHDINLMLNIHAKSIDKEMQIYAKDIQIWIDKFAQIDLIETETDIKVDSKFIEEVGQLYNKTCESRDVVYDSISNEIYEKTYQKRMTNWLTRKWPWN